MSTTKRREESLELRGLSNMIMQLRKLCNHPFVFEEVESAVNPTKINNAEGRYVKLPAAVMALADWVMTSQAMARFGGGRCVVEEVGKRYLLFFFSWRFFIFIYGFSGKIEGQRVLTFPPNLRGR
jgi:SNF2 family DNA or RNA helicase